MRLSNLCVNILAWLCGEDGHQWQVKRNGSIGGGILIDTVPIRIELKSCSVNETRHSNRRKKVPFRLLWTHAEPCPATEFIAGSVAAVRDAPAVRAAPPVDLGVPAAEHAVAARDAVELARGPVERDVAEPAEFAGQGAPSADVGEAAAALAAAVASAAADVVAAASAVAEPGRCSGASSEPYSDAADAPCVAGFHWEPCSADPVAHC